MEGRKGAGGGAGALHCVVAAQSGARDAAEAALPQAGAPLIRGNA
jgi:hypothetical protein